MENKLYRYETDKSTEEFTGNLELKEFLIEKETEKGYWITVNRKKKFILKGGNGKRFAYETKELALNGFIKRKERQIVLNKVFINRANTELEKAIELLTT